MVIVPIRLVALLPAEPVAATTRHSFFRELTGIPPVLLARYRPMAEGGRPVGPGSSRGRAGEHPRSSRDTLPCPAAVRTLGAPPRRAWPTEGLPCHNTGGGAPEGGVPHAGPVSCCRWQ